jgi:hypothetical protein
MQSSKERLRSKSLFIFMAWCNLHEVKTSSDHPRITFIPATVFTPSMWLVQRSKLAVLSPFSSFYLLFCSSSLMTILLFPRFSPQMMAV